GSFTGGTAIADGAAGAMPAVWNADDCARRNAPDGCTDAGGAAHAGPGLVDGLSRCGSRTVYGGSLRRSGGGGAGRGPDAASAGTGPSGGTGTASAAQGA